jgi:putative hydrolase of the HAD superfamily
MHIKMIASATPVSGMRKCTVFANRLYAQRCGGYGQIMAAKLDHIDTWIFDLDNTLYPASCDLFALIDEKMGLYLQNLLECDAVEARRVQKDYFLNHGTTLSGLMAKHDTDPHDFLAFVHDIALDRVTANTALVASIAQLPGRKLVFTNGDTPYAQRVLNKLGLGESFEAIHDIHDSKYLPKPDPRAYYAMCARLAVNPETAFFAEDMARNLKPAKALGMATLWINNGSEYGEREACPSFIDHETRDMADWLTTHLEQESV